VISKLGIIQSRGLGDIIIALPIAKHFHDRGIKVYWPIDESFLPSFATAVDYVTFLPFRFAPDLDGFLNKPLALLKQAGCASHVVLYSALTTGSASIDVTNKALFASLKFDEYKYAVAGVPFGEKWNLSIKRDREREAALYRELVTRDDYVVAHRSGSNFKVTFDLPARCKGMPCIEVTERTTNIFDWLTIFERARELFLIDSCFSNAVEQLNFTNEKSFLLRSGIHFTPVLRNKWKFFGDATPPPRVKS
jgi:hypothetical protein